MKRFVGLIVSVVLLVATGVAGKLTGAFQDAFTGGIKVDLGSILTAVAAILAFFTVEQILSLVVGAIHPKNRRTHTALTISVSILKYFFGILALCAVLAAFGADVGTVVAGVGILALIIGFGAESLVADLITGMFILLEGQYNVGDIVEVNGFRGTVTNIGIRTTSVTDMGGNVMIINNSGMKNVLNRSDKKSRAACIFPIPYSADLEKLEAKLPEILEAIHQQHKGMMLSCPVYLGIDSFADSAVNLRFTVEVEEKDIFAAGRVMNHDLYLAMQKQGIEIPFPQMDIHSC